MNLRAIWSFIAGDSKLAPLAVALAVAAVLALIRFVPGTNAVAGVIFVTIVAAGLVAGVFERV